MIHELLLALSGYPGSIFTWNKRNGLQVSQDLPFLHPSETSVLNLLCKLGTDYIRFTEFIEQYTGHVQHPFHLLFPSVMIVVEQIKSEKIHGCQLLETVYKHSCGGLPPVRSALEKILAVCHGVMYKQLSAWMLHGLLLDQYEEFFVRQGSASGNASTQPDEEDDDLGIGGLTGKQLRELQDLRLIEEENMLAPTLKQFSLRVEMLPSYIPVRVAEKILFVGESVQMFENRNVTMTRTGSILKNQEDIFAAELHRLKQQPLFNLVDFESVLDRIRSTVAEHLWKLMVEESDLIGQLKIIKDFYLLGRGELFQAFIDIAQNMLKMPPTEHDINVAFQLSAHKVLLDDDNLLPLLHLTIDYHGKEHKDMSQPRDAASRDTSPREAPTSGWAALGLFYKVQWPLHILFTPAILEKNLIARLPDRGKKILDYTEKVRAAIAEHVIEKRAKSPVHQKEKFKPNRLPSNSNSSTTNQSLGERALRLSAEERRTQDRKHPDDITAARLPPLHYLPALQIPLEESLTLQIEQKKSYEEKQAKFAAERLFEKLNIKMEPYNPEGDSYIKYQDQSDEEEEGLWDEEKMEPYYTEGDSYIKYQDQSDEEEEGLD